MMKAVIVALGLILATISMPIPQSMAMPKAEKQARIYFRRGKIAFKRHNYSAALKNYRRAYQLLPLPGFLFNIGQCLRNLGQNEESIAYFRQYISEKPEAPNRLAVEKLIREMEAKANNTANPNAPIHLNPSNNGTSEEAPQSPSTHEKKTVLQNNTVPIYQRDEESLRRPKPFSLSQQDLVKPTPTKPFYKKWWFWVPVATVIASGGVLGIYFATRGGDPSYPASPFGVWDISR